MCNLTFLIGRIFLNLVVKANLQRTSHQLHPIQLTNGSLSILSAVESDQTKSSLPTIITLGNFCTIHFAALTEMIFEFTPSGFPTKVPHE